MNGGNELNFVKGYLCGVMIGLVLFCLYMRYELDIKIFIDKLIGKKYEKNGKPIPQFYDDEISKWGGE